MADMSYSISVEVGYRFVGHQEAIKAVEDTGKATNQVFVMAAGNAKIAKTHILHHL